MWQGTADTTSWECPLLTARKQAPRPSYKAWDSAKSQWVRRDWASEDPDDTLISVCDDLKQRTQRLCARVLNHGITTWLNLCSFKLLSVWWCSMQQKTSTEVKTGGLQHYGSENNGFKCHLKWDHFSLDISHSLIHSKYCLNVYFVPVGIVLGAEIQGQRKQGGWEAPGERQVQPQSWRYWRCTWARTKRINGDQVNAVSAVCMSWGSTPVMVL